MGAFWFCTKLRRSSTQGCPSDLADGTASASNSSWHWSVAFSTSDNVWPCRVAPISTGQSWWFLVCDHQCVLPGHLWLWLCFVNGAGVHCSTGCTACGSSPLPAFPTMSSQLELVCCQHSPWFRCTLSQCWGLLSASQRKRHRSLAVGGKGCVSVMSPRVHLFRPHHSTVTLGQLLCRGILVLHKVEQELHTRLPE